MAIITRIVLAPLCLALACMALAACQAEPGAVSTLGTYQDYVAAPASQVAPAAVKAVQQMELRLGSATDRKVVAYYRDGTMLTISIIPWARDVTRLEVRVDPGGSESLSVSTIQKIKANVAAAPVAAPPAAPTVAPASAP